MLCQSHKGTLNLIMTILRTIIGYQDRLPNSWIDDLIHHIQPKQSQVWFFLCYTYFILMLFRILWTILANVSSFFSPPLHCDTSESDNSCFSFDAPSFIPTTSTYSVSKVSSLCSKEQNDPEQFDEEPSITDPACQFT